MKILWGEKRRDVLKGDGEKKSCKEWKRERKRFFFHASYGRLQETVKSFQNVLNEKRNSVYTVKKLSLGEKNVSENFCFQMKIVRSIKHFSKICI